MPRLPDQRADDNRWPEWPRVCKTDYGQEEAVAVFGRDPRIYQTTVKELLTDSEGNLRAVKVVRLEAGTDKKTGRTVMHEVAGSEEELPCQLLLIAAGFLGPQAYVAETFGLSAPPLLCQHRPRRIRHQCAQGVRRRRHAQGPVPGGLGHPGRARRRPRGGHLSDGVQQLKSLTAGAVSWVPGRAPWRRYGSAGLSIWIPEG